MTDRRVFVEDGQTFQWWDDAKPEDAAVQAFRKFHAANPDVYRSLRQLALQLKRKGHVHYGIGSLYEVMRWHRALKTVDVDFKLNNNYRAYYARLLMQNVPELSGFFSLRVSKADGETLEST